MRKVKTETRGRTKSSYRRTSSHIEIITIIFILFIVDIDIDVTNSPSSVSPTPTPQQHSSQLPQQQPGRAAQERPLPRLYHLELDKVRPFSIYHVKERRRVVVKHALWRLIVFGNLPENQFDLSIFLINSSRDIYICFFDNIYSILDVDLSFIIYHLCPDRLED